MTKLCRFSLVLSVVYFYSPPWSHLLFVAKLFCAFILIPFLFTSHLSQEFSEFSSCRNMSHSSAVSISVSSVPVRFLLYPTIPVPQQATATKLLCIYFYIYNLQTGPAPTRKSTFLPSLLADNYIWGWERLKAQISLESDPNLSIVSIARHRLIGRAIITSTCQ